MERGRRGPCPRAGHVALPRSTMKPLAVLAVLLAGFSLAPGAAPQPGRAEPPPPDPIPAVRDALLEAVRHEMAQRWPEALAAAERALALAQREGDRVGIAHAHRSRAWLLPRAGREGEAAAAWRETAVAWERCPADRRDGAGLVEALAQEGRLLLEAQPEDASRHLARAAQLGEAEERRPLAAAQALHSAAQALYDALHMEPAGLLYAAALRIRERRVPGSIAHAESLVGVGIVAYVGGDPETARRHYERARAIVEPKAADSQLLATILANLGLVARRQGDLTVARGFFLRALAIEERLPPDSESPAVTRVFLAEVEWQAGNRRTARDYLQHARAVLERVAPDSTRLAQCLNALGNLAQTEGDLRSARGHFEAARRHLSRVAPGSQFEATALGNLGVVAEAEGDVAAAWEHQWQAYEIRARLVPDSLDVASSLNNLGLLAQIQGDLPMAEDYHRRALAIRQKEAPGSLEEATSLVNLAIVARLQGEYAAAEAHARQALAVHERHAPESLGTAESLSALGHLAQARERWEEARGLYQRALDLRVRLAPGSGEVAESWVDLGAASDALGSLDEAEACFRRALAIQKGIAPDSIDVAICLNNLRVVARERGRLEEAEQLAARAWRLARRHADILAGDEARQAFYRARAPFAAALVDCQVARKRFREAFRTLEEGRAQAIQRLLLERTLRATTETATLWNGYRAAVVRRDGAGRLLGEASLARSLADGEIAAAEGRGAPDEEVGRWRGTRAAAQESFLSAQSHYLQARQEADQSWSRLQQKLPRVIPAAVNAQHGRTALPPGMLFAAFSVGEERIHLFLLASSPEYAEGPQVFTLPGESAALRQQVALFLAACSKNEAAVTANRGHALFQTLFPPEARAAVLAAKRLVIAPDGLLWEVPWPALVVSARRPAAPQDHLGLLKPLTLTPSMTLFRQCRRERPRRLNGAPRVLALGGALFQRGDRPLPVAGEWQPLFRGIHLDPLGGSAEEASGVARLYGRTALLGEAATEPAVRARIGAADVAHFATHGFEHPGRAMASGVLLTQPRDAVPVEATERDGCLQAWEVFSQLRLRAELVVLSACETARGENIPAEGLVGLVRSFQVAGARSVVATRWQIPDRITTRLMLAFHRDLRAGVAKDEALRRAMADVARQPDTRHPFYWASFMLAGDPDNSNLASPKI